MSDQNELEKIVDDMGLEGEQIVAQAEAPNGQKLLNEDFQQARNLGAMGFPTILMVNEEKKGVKIVGGRPLDFYIQGLKQILGKEELEPK
ncbi:DsbA family protein [Allobacillus sp. GCM10007491]|uniref:DsbA family protein n=1 Tax=Allobacillus TaxID=1400133 RepID=UPI0030141ABF